MRFEGIINSLYHMLIEEEHCSSFRTNHQEEHATFNDIAIGHAIRHGPEYNCSVR